MLKRAITTADWAQILQGCAHNAESMQRQPAVESTIGTDPSKLPAGTVDGPRDMGVDLSDRSSEAPAELGA